MPITTTKIDASRLRDPQLVRGILLMVACLGFFTVTALLIRHLSAGHEVSTWTLVLLRGAVGLSIVLVFYGRRSGLRLTRLFTRPALIIRGLLGTVGLCAYYWTIPKLGAGMATLLSNLYVVLGAVFASCFLIREKLNTKQFLWLLISLSGVAFLTEARSGLSFEVLVALVGATSAGMVIVIIRYLHRSEATPTIFASQCVYAMLAVAPFAFPEILRLHGSLLLWALVASLTAALGQLTMTHAFRYLSVSLGGAFHLTIPVWISLGGYFLFGEVLSLWQLFGATLVLLGCFKAIRP